jgi:pilus assembly protein TadC
VSFARADGRAHRRRPFRLRLPVPLILIWLLLAPIALLLSPVLLVACLILRLNPFTAAAVLIALAVALSGTRIEVESPGARVDIRLF